MADLENPASEIGPGEEPSAPRVSAGHMLRDARLRAGLTLAKVSTDLRISSSLLEAIGVTGPQNTCKHPSCPY